MKKKIMSIVLIAAAVGMAVLSWALLPETVVVQVGVNGQSTNTMPKFLAVVAPLCVSVVGSVLNLLEKEETGKKGLVLGIAGVAVMVLSLIFNR